MARRSQGTAEARARALQAYFGAWPEGALVPPRVVLERPLRLVGMGALNWLEIARPSGNVEQWTFRGELPRLCFTHDTPALPNGKGPASTRTPSRAFIVGGAYRVTPERGFENTSADIGMEALDVRDLSREMEKELASYRRTHGKLDPTEAWRASLKTPRYFVPVGLLLAVCYRADKNETGWRNKPYRHAFSRRRGPWVFVDEHGQLWLVGGRFTVTPHGFEDQRR